MSLDSEVCCRKIARNLPRRKDRLIAVIFFKTRKLKYHSFCSRRPRNREKDRFRNLDDSTSNEPFQFLFHLSFEKKHEACVTLRQQFVIMMEIFSNLWRESLKCVEN